MPDSAAVLPDEWFYAVSICERDLADDTRTCVVASHGTYKRPHNLGCNHSGGDRPRSKASEGTLLTWRQSDRSYEPASCGRASAYVSRGMGFSLT